MCSGHFTTRVSKRESSGQKLLPRLVWPDPPAAAVTSRMPPSPPRQRLQGPGVQVALWELVLGDDQVFFLNP